MIHETTLGFLSKKSSIFSIAQMVNVVHHYVGVKNDSLAESFFVSVFFFIFLHIVFWAKVEKNNQKSLFDVNSFSPCYFRKQKDQFQGGKYSKNETVIIEWKLSIINGYCGVLTTNWEWLILNLRRKWNCYISLAQERTKNDNFVEKIRY